MIFYTNQADEQKGPMSTVLDEVTSDTIDATHIKRRVDDWEGRLKMLFEAIVSWLPEGWEAHPSTPVPMLEELMQKYGVEERPVPTLELRSQSGHCATLEPRALWIIGDNGRVDLKHDGNRYLIVDQAKNLEEPDWQVMNAQRRWERETFNRDWLQRLLL